MTLALDHTAAAFVTPRSARLARALRAWVAASHHRWFVEGVEPDDPFGSMSSRDR